MRDRAFAGMFVKAALLATGCLLSGCHTRDADEGSVRVTRAQVIGVYETKSVNGSERLELKGDGTYVQDFSSKSRPFHHTGQWRIENLFLDGSEVVLSNAALLEDDGMRPLSLCYSRDFSTIPTGLFPTNAEVVQKARVVRQQAARLLFHICWPLRLHDSAHPRSGTLPLC